jgi:DNA replicative helicase MCM subunit Mcm2 (Cdc46/Mcm family)
LNEKYIFELMTIISNLRWISTIDSNLKSSYDSELNRLSIDIDWMIFANENPELAELLLKDPRRFLALCRNQLLVLWKDEQFPLDTLRLWIRPFGIPFVSLLEEQSYQTKHISRFHGKVWRFNDSISVR